MSNFILVHGAWLGAWSWERLVEQMEAARESRDVGEVLPLELPGHGQRFEDEIRLITMEHYIQSVVTPIQVKRLYDVVLVGHGFAATFLPQAAMQLADRVKRVVFIAGELPPEGSMVSDRLSLWEKVMLWVFKAGEKGFRFPDFIFKGMLCNGLDGRSTDEVLSRLVAEPFLPWKTPVFREGFVGKFPITYVVLTRDKAIPPRLQRLYSQTVGSPNIEELDAGHGVLFSHPREIASILLKFA